MGKNLKQEPGVYWKEVAELPATYSDTEIINTVTKLFEQHQSLEKLQTTLYRADATAHATHVARVHRLKTELFKRIVELLG